VKSLSGISEIRRWTTALSGGHGSDDVTAPDVIDVPRWVYEDLHRNAVMFEMTTVGLDLSKNVFQAHGADVSGRSHYENRKY
jgi:hypothetical protein